MMAGVVWGERLSSAAWAWAWEDRWAAHAVDARGEDGADNGECAVVEAVSVP